jgi:hypothetical protein
MIQDNTAARDAASLKTHETITNSNWLFFPTHHAAQEL